MTKNAKEPGLIKPRFSSASILRKEVKNPCLVTGIEIVPDMVRIFRGVSGTVSALLI